MANYNLGTIEGDIKIRYDSAGIDKAIEDQDKYVRKTSDASAAVQNLGNKSLGAGALIAGGLGVAVKTAADFEKTLSGVKAVSGATADEMEKIRAKAMQIGEDTAFSSTQAAMAMEELVKAGISVTDTLNGAADATVALAAAGGIDLPRAAEIAAAAMNNFNLSAKDMPHIADLIAGAANASAIDVGDFGESLKQAGASAALVGLSFDDLAVAITAMGNAGIKGSDAGTSLKTFLSNLQPSTKEQIKLFDKLGITTNGMKNKFFDANGSIRSMAEVSGVLDTALKGMTDQQRFATLEMMFGSDAIRAAAVIAKEGSKGIDELTAALNKTKAADVAKTRMDNFSGTLDNMKGTMENAAISIGTILIPVLRDIVEAVDKAFTWFNNLPGPIKEIITQVLVWSAASLLLVGGLIKVGTMVGNTVKSVFTLIGWCDKLLGAFLKVGGSGTKAILTGLGMYIKAAGQFVLASARMVASAIATSARVVASWVVMGVQSLIQAGRMAAAWIIAMGPVAWVIAAIIALVALIIAFWDEIVAALTTAWNWISDLAQQVWGSIVSWFHGLWEGFVTWLTGLWQGIVDWLTSLWTGFSTFFTDLWTTITTWLGSVWQGILDTASAIWQAIVDFVVGVMLGFVETIRGIIQTIVDFFVNLWNNVSGAVSSFASNVWNGIKNGVVNAYNAVTEWLGKVIQWFRDLPGKIWDALGNVGRILWDAGVKLIQGFWDGIKAIWNKLVGWVEDGMEWLRGLWPFSPAKWGPFSGKGYVTHSGEAMTMDFADSLLNGIPLIGNAAERLMSAAQGSLAPSSLRTSTGSFALAGKAAAREQFATTRDNEIREIVIQNLNQQITGNLDPTKPVEWRKALVSIKDGIRDVERENR